MSQSNSLHLSCFCGRLFSKAEDLQDHRKARGHISYHKCQGSCKASGSAAESTCVFVCRHCGDSFHDEESLHKHRIATGHCYCAECEEVFATPFALKAHLKVHMHASEFRCCDCDVGFDGIDALNAHMKKKVHRPMTKKKPHVCPHCRKGFMTTKRLNDHTKAKHAVGNKEPFSKSPTSGPTTKNTPAQAASVPSVRLKRKIPCSACNRKFKTDKGLREHKECKHHNRPVVPLTSCTECNKTFKSKISLKDHMNSPKHKPLMKLSCPFGKKCSTQFTQISALISHLESGGCGSKMTRENIQKLITTYDTDNIIHTPVESFLSESTPSLLSGKTSPALICATPDISDTTSEWSIVTSSSLSGVQEALEEWSFVEDTAENSIISLPIQTKKNHLRCPLCPSRVFKNKSALQSHMASPAHSPKIYHCPLNLDGMKKQSTAHKHFSTLGGLTQHLESGACVGGKKALDTAVAFLENRLKQLGFSGLTALFPKTLAN